MQGDPTVKKFNLHNGALVYHTARSKAKRYLLPDSLRPMELDYFHCSPSSTHLGMTKTLNRISRVFYWSDMRRQVCKFVRACLQCSGQSPPRILGSGSIAVRLSPTYGEVFYRFVGPLVRSRKENIAVLVLLDGFSKFVMMYPVRRISSESLATCLAESYFPSFGVLFKSNTFYNLYFSWGCRHIATSPYYPQASQFGHFNRNLKVALTIYHNAQHTHLDDYLASITLAFNSAWHESTAATTASLFLGKDVNNPLPLR
jgi:hypothetical protein